MYTRYIYKKIMVFSILKKKEQSSLPWVSKKDAQDSDGKNCGYYYDLKNRVQSRGP